MGILDFLKRDARAITSNTDDFAQEVRFQSRKDATEAEVSALHTRHHLGFDLQTAQEVNTMKAHVTVAEDDLLDWYYPVRDSKNEVDMMGDIVWAADVNGVERKYEVLQQFPNERVGTISFILGKRS